MESRVAALEEGATYDATKQLIRQREMEFLSTLREIRTTMANEQKSGGGSGSGANASEIEALKSENAHLKSVIAKQEYRIRHLITGFEKLMEEKQETK